MIVLNRISNSQINLIFISKFLLSIICYYNRSMKALEEVHRKLALQEFRTKRDRLALDCVKLGKIVPMRTVRNIHIYPSIYFTFI